MYLHLKNSTCRSRKGLAFGVDGLGFSSAATKYRKVHTPTNPSQRTDSVPSRIKTRTNENYWTLIIEYIHVKIQEVYLPQLIPNLCDDTRAIISVTRDPIDSRFLQIRCGISI